MGEWRRRKRKIGVTREVSGECTGTQGKVSGEEHRMEKRGKRGKRVKTLEMVKSSTVTT